MLNRTKDIAERLKSLGADALVIHSPVNRRYLTGMRSSAGVVVVTASGECILAVDFRYITAARSILAGTGISTRMIPSGGENAWVSQLILEKKIKKVAVEDEYLTASVWKQLEAQWGTELLGASSLLLALRRIKDREELEKIQFSQQIAEKSLKETLEMVHPGVTERQIEAYLTWRILENGGENGIFGIVVASGPNSALPHAMPTDRAVQKGEFLLIDFGAIYDGYYSDITRTVAIGSCDEEMRRVYELVLAANCASIDAIRPGITGGEADAVARDMISAAGYGDFFGHGLGHAVGLDIHEQPALRQGSADLLVPGCVVTSEPGIYLPSKFGVRIEDLLEVTQDGSRNLTSMSKNLIIL